MLSKKILAIVFLIVLLSPTFVQNVAIGQNDKENYCPESVDKKYCHKVIIIGAGMAGLGAANELKSHGFDVIVLEGGSIPGGRVVTHYWNNTAFDLHASWISGADGNPITELAQKYGSHLRTTWNNYTYYDDNGLITDTKRLTNLNSNVANHTWWLDPYRNHKTDSNDEPLQNAIDQYIQNHTDTMTENDKKDFLFETTSFVGNEYAYDPKDISLLNWDKIGYKVGNTDNETVFLDGYDKIPNHLANNLDGSIQYKTKVTLEPTKIHYNETGVQVDTDKGSYYGKYVICTVSIDTLQSRSIEFDPKLPNDKNDTIYKMQEGTLAQTYIFFNGTNAMPKTFWNNTVDYYNYIPPMNETGHWTTFLNMYKIKGQHALMAFNYGDYAINVVLAESESKMKNDLSHIFKIMNGSSTFNKNSIIVYPGARGESPSYSTSPIGFRVPEDYDILASPIHDKNGINRIFFAGEATTWHYPATTHGAFLTGLREANRVMVTDTGIYPPPLKQEDDWRYPPNGDTGILAYSRYNSGAPIHVKFTDDKKHTWLTFPEYVICRPGHVLVLENNTEKTPICVTHETEQRLSDWHFIVNLKPS